MYLIINTTIILVLIIYVVQQGATIRSQQQCIEQFEKMLRRYETNVMARETLIAKYEKLHSIQKGIDKANH